MPKVQFNAQELSRKDREMDDKTKDNSSLLDVHVLLMSSLKTGKISVTITALGKAQLQLYALQSTPRNKKSHIFNRRTGHCVMIVYSDGKIEKGDNLGKCDEYGIPLAELQKIKDDRFDKKENAQANQ